MASAKTESAIFVQLCDAQGASVLRAGRLLAVANDRYHGDFAAADLEMPPATHVVLCYERGEQFMKEHVRVVSLDRTSSRVLVEFEVIGSAVAAESRESYRVPTGQAKLTARLGDRDDCAVLDLSERGMAIESDRAYAIGDQVPAVLYHDGEALPGTVDVRNARPLGGGRYRYGLRCLDGSAEREPLQRALPRIHDSLRERDWSGPTGIAV